MTTTERAEAGVAAGVRPGAALAIWATCFFGGAVFGLLTDRDVLSPGPPQAAAERPAALPAPTADAGLRSGGGRRQAARSTTTAAPAEARSVSLPGPIVLPDLLAGPGAGDTGSARPGAGAEAADDPGADPADGAGGGASGATTTEAGAGASTSTTTTAPDPSTTTTGPDPTTTTSVTLLPGVPISRPG